jgi:hypothetical protein
MPTEPEPVRLSDLARRAAEICDPSLEDPAIGSLLAQLEDDDRPVTAVQDLEERLAVAAEEADAEVEDPAVSMAVAAILYLAHRRDEVDADPDEVLRLAARAEWKGRPPAYVVEWLAGRGVTV